MGRVGPEQGLVYSAADKRLREVFVGRGRCSQQCLLQETSEAYGRSYWISSKQMTETQAVTKQLLRVLAGFGFLLAGLLYGL